MRYPRDVETEANILAAAERLQPGERLTLEGDPARLFAAAWACLVNRRGFAFCGCATGLHLWRLT